MFVSGESYHKAAGLAPDFHEAVIPHGLVTQSDARYYWFIQLEGRDVTVNITLSVLLWHCGEYWQKLQPDTKYSGYLNTQGNMSESKNTLHTHLYDEFGEGFGDRLQHFRRFFSAVQLKATDGNSGQVTHQTRHHLHRQQNQHRQPVKTVMDRRPSKRPWEREHRWSTKGQQQQKHKFTWSL